MTNKRNIGIIGAPDSGANEVFEAIKRHSDKMPKAPSNPYIVEGNVDWGEYGDSEKPPYDAKKRDKFMKGLSK